MHHAPRRAGAVTGRRSYWRIRIVTPSAVVALNRAVAVGMGRGPAAGLAAVDALAADAGDPALARYHLFHSVRGDLLMKLGRLPEAREQIQRAIALTQNLRERELLTDRLRQTDP